MPYRLSWLPATAELLLDTRHSGSAEGRISRAPLPSGKRLQLQLLLDRSTLEVFAADGTVVLSACIFPDADAQGISLQAEGDIHIEQLAFWPLNAKPVHMSSAEGLTA
ncbi:Levanbiose-producing levanase [Chromobacterium violaceum]|uniref:Levanbiose-producing levanase n=1 Tax=Chromobacterium violaceum TaxID=536 RepID=A0A447TH02_CHRVL|nr:Levanbiose-producing levanase [Chromobacterium violaceum]